MSDDFNKLVWINLLKYLFCALRYFVLEQGNVLVSTLLYICRAFSWHRPKHLPLLPSAKHNLN